MMKIRKGKEADFGQLLEIWERSVSATHDFLSSDDVASIKKDVEKYFSAVDLSLCDDGKTLGFIGVNNKKIEMLFVEPSCFGRGVGRFLIEHAMLDKNIEEVDVNEQNPKALGFYDYMGFRVVGRSEFDSEGRPFPILHLRLVT